MAVVHETENVLANFHTRPHWPVRIVVIPELHVPSLTDPGEAPIGRERDQSGWEKQPPIRPTPDTQN